MGDEPKFDVSAEINVTPMIDVLLSLLIIFMVASPPPSGEQQPISIPQDPIAETPNDPNATLLISIDADGKATLGETPLPDDYAGRVKAIKESEKAQADGRLAVNADGKVAYGQVIEVMSAAREAGIPSVGLASERL